MSERGDMLREVHEDQLADAHTRRDALQTMLASPGWEILNSWMQEEINIRRREYETEAPHGRDDTYILSFRRSQLSMLRTIQDMPQKLLAVENDAIEQVKLAIGDEDA